MERFYGFDLGDAESAIARLEKEDQVVFRLVFTKVTEDPQGHAHVDVVPAGVHDAGVGGFIRKARIFFHRQGVDIGSVADISLGVAALDQNQQSCWQFAWLFD